MARIFSLLGDSNVKRHMNPTNCRDRPMMSGCEVLPCGRFSVLAEALKSVRSESNVVLLSCLTNFITMSEESGSIATRVVPIFQDVASLIGEEAGQYAGRFYLISPPMYRLTPLWYRDGLPEILTKFASTFRGLPKNVLLMPSFASPVLESDGVHLSLYSGMEFVLHLFDSANSVIEALSLPLAESIKANQEAARSLEDRVVVLEQDHQRLNRDFESKFAEDSEYADFQTNLREESFFTVSGLQRLPNGLSPKEWQQRAVLDVQGVLTILMGKEYPIVFVQNGTSKRKDAPATYLVLMKFLDDSKAIRTKFGSYFLGGGGPSSLPEALRKISLQNKVTPATYGRVLIMKALGARYVAANKGSSFKVIGYDPRPLLKLFPAPDAADRRVQSYNFIEAINSLPTNLTKEECSDIVKRLSPKLHGRLRSTFRVISDDMLPKKQKTSKGGASGQGSSDQGGSSGSGGSSGKGSDRKRGATSPASGSSGKKEKQKK